MSELRLVHRLHLSLGEILSLTNTALTEHALQTQYYGELPLHHAFNLVLRLLSLVLRRYISLSSSPPLTLALSISLSLPHLSNRLSPSHTCSISLSLPYLSNHLSPSHTCSISLSLPYLSNRLSPSLPLPLTLALSPSVSLISLTASLPITLALSPPVSLISLTTSLPLTLALSISPNLPYLSFALSPTHTCSQKPGTTTSKTSSTTQNTKKITCFPVIETPDAGSLTLFKGILHNCGRAGISLISF